MAKEADVPAFKLSNSKLIPAVGLGTISREHADKVTTAILKALEVGYRHIDTASAYTSESAIGNALQEAFAKGLVKREDLFVTTKIAPNQLHIDQILPTLKTSLRKLQLDYVDLYLIHWPYKMKPGTPYKSTNVEDYPPLDMKGTWEAMEKLVELGLTKSIGVSNFHMKALQKVLSTAKIHPVVNQIELHPQWQQDKVRAFCKKKGIHVSAWSPIGAPGAPYGTVGLLEHPVMKGIAEKHGQSVPQISLRWVHELGASAIPKSFSEKRMIENLDIWDFSLTEEDHEKIKTIEQSTLMNGDMFPQFKGSPWRSFEEFWGHNEEE